MIYAVVVMGVSGSGKSTVGKALAEALGCPFYDGDDYHSAENIARMSSGIPLTDEDRRIWLDQLRALIHKQIIEKELAIVACSALKKSYRERLQVDEDHVAFVYLKGHYEQIWQRMQGRTHYMRPEMLESQFNALEEPALSEALILDIGQDVDRIVEQILEGLA